VYVFTQLGCLFAGAVMLLGILGGPWLSFLLVGVLLVNTFKLIDGLLLFEAVGVLEKDQRERQVARFSTSRNFAGIIGAPVGAVIWATAGPGPALLANLLSFSVPLIGYVLIRPLLQRSHESTKANFSEAVSRRLRLPGDVVLALFLFIAFGFFSSIQSPATVKFVIGPLGLGPQWFGYLEAVWGLGAVAASAWSKALQGEDKLRSMLLFMGLYSLSLSVLGFIPSLLVAIPAYLLAAAGLVIANIAFTNYLYDRLPPSERFVVRATSTAWQSGALAAGFSLGGVFIRYPQILTIVSGVSCLTLAAVGLLVSRAFAGQPVSSGSDISEDG
jgi:hypothetical protein